MRPSEAARLPRCKCGRTCPKGKRKCAKCLSTKGYKVVQGRDSRKGRNATGIAAHKPDRSRVRRAKRQNTGNLGMEPTIAATKWDYV